MEIFIKNITVDEKEYKLQHPGTRAYLDLKKKFIKIRVNSSGETETEIDSTKMLDYFFANCVIPANSGSITLDDIPLSQLEIWEAITMQFLRGDRNLKEIWLSDESVN